MKKLIIYFLSFISSIFLVLFSILLILNVTVFNKNYVLKQIESHNYYSKVYKEIKKDMKNRLMSSGLDNSVLDNLYTKNDVKKDVKGFVSAIYSGYSYDASLDSFKEKLENNIDKFLADKNVEVSDKESLDSYVSSVMKVYENEVTLYGYLDGFSSKFIKASNYLTVGMGISLICFAVLYLIVRCVFHKKYLGIIILSSSMMFLYLKYFIYEKIDYKNILIISNSFSEILRKLLDDIGNYVLFISVIYMVFGLVLIIKHSYKKVKRRRN